MQNPKRRTYLADKNFQFYYMGLMIIPLILLLSALYYLIYFSVFNEILIPEAIITTLLPAMRRVNTILIIAVPILLFLIIRASLVYSNRIIGPIPRLERELDKAIIGDFSVRVKARNKDELKSLIDKINMLLKKTDKALRDCKKQPTS